jgi:PAS domain S-box-containing protein
MGPDKKSPPETPDRPAGTDAGGQSTGVEVEALSGAEVKSPAPELEAKQNEAWRRSTAGLEAASQRYRDFYDSAPVGFVTLEASGLIREVNRTAASQLGAAGDSLIHQPFASFIAAGDQERFHRFLAQIFQAAGPHRSEIRLARADGGQFVARLDGVAATDADGQQVCRASLTDISELQQTEKKLRESERLFAAFMEHLPSVAVIRDAHGRYLFANAAWEQAFHRNREECRSKTSDELWPPEVAAKFKEQDRLVIERGEPLQSVVTLPQADGLHHWIYFRFPIVDEFGQPAMIGVNAIDVTEPLETKARLEHLLVSGPAAIYTFKAEGIFAPTYISDNVKGLVGWEPADFLDNPRFWIKHVHPEDRRRVLKRVELPWPEDHQSFEYRFLAKDGAYRWMHDEIRLVPRR